MRTATYKYIKAETRLGFINKAQRNLFIALTTKFPEKKPKKMTHLSWKKMLACKELVELSMGNLAMVIIELTELSKRYDD